MNTRTTAEPVKHETADPHYECNVCGGSEFLDIKSRPKVRCASCNSLERSRLLQLVLNKEGFIKEGHKVLHIAPEAGVGRNIRAIVGEGYDAIDLRPSIYPEDLMVRRFDLITDTEKLLNETYDVIIHSHVMEHIPCDITSVLWHLHRSLKPNGVHIFCLPILPGRYECDFNEITNDDRTKRFGQFDHVRKFGADDLDRNIGKVFRLNPYDASKVLNEATSIRYKIPLHVLKGINSNTVFIQDKRSLLLQ
ncbi:class I SAM-dependent methyltransferase (plasmid) [Rhizobium sullae]|uniref:Class I SAM-dependent methyltransferase n=1 Tax=Rhizobium sullae TaxID=50338 RepID=A0ABY5XRY7_RHISU|nr:methyltransferase domain-containing protein [Rhizobium sullae]UWU16944.1 class I SAM-dependent methyltransferase [Rhizobium sullae]